MKKIWLTFIVLSVVVVIVFYVYKLYATPSQNQVAPIVTNLNLNINAADQSLLKPEIKLTKAPEQVKPDEEFAVEWQIEIAEPRPIFHTAVHFGPESKSGEITVKSYPELTKIQQGTIPASFADKIAAAKNGKIYLRAHVIVDTLHYWTDEKVIEIRK